MAEKLCFSKIFFSRSLTFKKRQTFCRHRCWRWWWRGKGVLLITYIYKNVVRGSILFLPRIMTRFYIFFHDYKTTTSDVFRIFVAIYFRENFFFTSMNFRHIKKVSLKTLRRMLSFISKATTNFQTGGDKRNKKKISTG